MKLAGRLSRVAPSATLAVKQAASELRAQGHNVVDFGPGEPDFPTAPHVVKAAQDALDRGETHYSVAAGLPELRQALARTMSSRANTEISPQQVIVTCGGKSAVLYAMLSLVQEGDEVVIPTPCWVSFPEQVKLAGGKPILVPTEQSQGFRPSVDSLQAVFTDRTRVLVVNSPANPSGALVTRPEWEQMLELVRSRDVVLLSDETYLGFVYDGATAVSGLDLAREFGDHLLVISSFSKSYAMTGWRVGYACGSPALIKAMVTLQSQDTTHPATFCQHGALAALEGPAESMQEMMSEYSQRRRLIVEELQKIAGFRCEPPDGAFYVFPDVKGAMQQTGCKDDKELALRLLREAHVAVVPGSAFSGPGHIRLSYAVSRHDIRQGMERVRQWVGDHSR